MKKNKIDVQEASIAFLKDNKLQIGDIMNVSTVKSEEKYNVEPSEKYQKKALKSLKIQEDTFKNIKKKELTTKKTHIMFVSENIANPYENSDIIKLPKFEEKQLKIPKKDFDNLSNIKKKELEDMFINYSKYASSRSIHIRDDFWPKFVNIINVLFSKKGRETIFFCLKCHSLATRRTFNVNNNHYKHDKVAFKKYIDYEENNLVKIFENLCAISEIFIKEYGNIRIYFPSYNISIEKIDKIDLCPSKKKLKIF